MLADRRDPQRVAAVPGGLSRVPPRAVAGHPHRVTGQQRDRPLGPRYDGASPGRHGLPGAGRQHRQHQHQRQQDTGDSHRHLGSGDGQMLRIVPPGRRREKRSTEPEHRHVTKPTTKPVHSSPLHRRVVVGSSLLHGRRSVSGRGLWLGSIGAARVAGCNPRPDTQTRTRRRPQPIRRAEATNRRRHAGELLTSRRGGQSARAPIGSQAGRTMGGSSRADGGRRAGRSGGPRSRRRARRTTSRSWSRSPCRPSPRPSCSPPASAAARRRPRRRR